MAHKVGLLGFAWWTILVCTVGAWGQYGGRSGTEEDPYQISTTSDWLELIDTSSDWDKHFILTNNIEFEGMSIYICLKKS